MGIVSVSARSINQDVVEVMSFERTMLVYRPGHSPEEAAEFSPNEKRGVGSPVMHPEMEMLRCAIVRGGTSKGVFVMMNEYPKDAAKRDAVILAVYGSPDVREIDGLGGADVLTSKHAIIARSSRPDADVDYTFAQVSFESAFVDYAGNCGNISSAVGPFAIDEGLVEAVEPTPPCASA